MVERYLSVGAGCRRRYPRYSGQAFRVQALAQAAEVDEPEE
ncbi:hypothetical protein [Microbacterium foliorum]